MSYEPENEPLDQTLRETFSEFDLPPSQRVWTGIEGRIGALPAARRQLPLKVLLPAVALVGVGIGWLLPRPAFLGTTPPVPAPTVLQQLSPPETVLVANAGAPQLPASAVATRSAADAADMSPSTISRRYTAANARQLMAPQTASKPAPTQPAAAQQMPAPSASDSEASVAAFQPPAADSAVLGLLASVAPYDPVPVAVTGAIVAPVIAPAEALMPNQTTAAITSPNITSPKPESQQEVHTEFRQPTHRMAERGRGIRRRLSAVAVWARQVVSPNRARTTGQPSF